jgi:Protein of unknown function (DUF2793)
MAYFKAKNLKLGTDQSIYFGDSDQARLWFDGTEWAATHTISGTAATADHHLIQKGQVDDSINTLSGTLTSYIDNHDWTESDITDLDKYTQSEVDTLISGVSAQIITDHGGLTGLADDDHTQYSLANGTRAFTGVVGGVTPTLPAHLTTKQYVDALVNGVDWQDSVISMDIGDPATISGTPNIGDRYIIDSPAGGVWAGNEGYIAEYNGTGWDLTGPNEGFASWVEDLDALYVYNGSAWVRFGSTVDHGNLNGLGDDDHTQYILVDGTRGFTATVSGVTPVLDNDLATKWYIDNELATISGGIVQDHGALTGLGDDDHTQYILADGNRDFTGIVSYSTHPSFVADTNIVDKKYVDDELSTVSGVIVSQIPSLTGYATESYVDDHNWYEADILDLDKYTTSEVDTLISGVEAQIITDHGGLTGLGDDDHTQYTLTTGARGFTGTVSGISPTASYHLTTKQYVDDEIATLSGSIVIDHGALTGLADDDHLQYVPTDGSRGFTATVSGIDPTQDYELTTKSYVDSVSVDRIQSGRVSLAYHDESKAVSLNTAFADTNYSISVLMTNTTDSNPSIYPVVVSAKSNSGFTVEFSGKIDTANYTLEWIAIHD